MAGFWRQANGKRQRKYLVKRRDGTVPRWPWFVLGAADPAAPAGLMAYAAEAERLGMDPEYVADVRAMAADWPEYRQEVGIGDPGAPRHRVDDPATVAEIDAVGG